MDIQNLGEKKTLFPFWERTPWPKGNLSERKLKDQKQWHDKQPWQVSLWSE